MIFGIFGGFGISISLTSGSCSSFLLNLKMIFGIFGIAFFSTIGYLSPYFATKSCNKSTSSWLNNISSWLPKTLLTLSINVFILQLLSLQVSSKLSSIVLVNILDILSIKLILFSAPSLFSDNNIFSDSTSIKRSCFFFLLYSINLAISFKKLFTKSFKRTYLCIISYSDSLTVLSTPLITSCITSNAACNTSISNLFSTCSPNNNTTLFLKSRNTKGDFSTLFLINSYTFLVIPLDDSIFLLIIFFQSSILSL